MTIDEGKIADIVQEVVGRLAEQGAIPAAAATYQVLDRLRHALLVLHEHKILQRLEGIADRKQGHVLAQQPFKAEKRWRGVDKHWGGGGGRQASEWGWWKRVLDRGRLHVGMLDAGDK